MPLKLRLLTPIALYLILYSGSAFGQSCTINAINGSYGAVDLLSGAAADTTTNVTVNCSGASNQTVMLCIEFGGGPTDGSGNRIMTSGSNSIRHELYTSAARTTIWGSWGKEDPRYDPYPFGLQYNLPLGASGSASHVFTVYGRILAGQNTARPGNYTWSTSGTPAIGFEYITAGAVCGSSTVRDYDPGGGGMTATIAANCIVSAAPMVFPGTALISGNIDTTSNITLRCTNSTPYNVGLSAGSGTGATVTTRKLTRSGGSTIDYSLYRNSTRTQIWGTTIGTNTVAGTGTGTDQTLVVYGRVPVQATPTSGTYSDTIVVTVTY